MAEKKGGSKKTSGARASGKKKSGGWGGPAKGAHPAKPAYKFGKPGPGRGHFSIAGENRLERESRMAEEMRELLYGFATDDGREDTIRLQASGKLLDRIEGLPVQKIVQGSSDPLSRMTDEQLAQYEAEQEARIAAHKKLTADDRDV
jgi:hypothetical protein